MTALVPQGMLVSEFVADTLLAIATGIREAENRIATAYPGVRINPDATDPQEIEFDIALAPVGARVASDDRGASRVRFKVAVSFPSSRATAPRPPDRAERPWLP